MNRRRRLLALLLGAAGAPRALFAQQERTWRVGYLQPFPAGTDARIHVFKRRLSELGFTEGKAISYEVMSAEGVYDRLPGLAAELVRRKVDVILADGGTPATVAAKAATQSIPIVFIAVGDPAGQGIVASLARPGGNVTGIAVQHPESAAKILGFLKEMVPSAKRIAILSNPANSSLPLVVGNMRAAARALDIETKLYEASAPSDFGRVFADMTRENVSGLALLVDALFTGESRQLAELAAKHRLPAVGGIDTYPDAGGLMSYGPDRLDLTRHAADLVAKILKGARPGDLPVQQPTKFDLVVNLKAAHALGLRMPQSILLQATRTIG